MTSQHNRWTAQWISEALKLSLTPSFLGLKFSSIVTDSRKIVPGCLFIAIRGDTFDGHDFISQAIQEGAKGILLREDHSALKTSNAEVCYFPVRDTLMAYRELAKAWRSRFPLPVAMVAGSNGKTTTKELIYALFQGKWDRVLKTQGSQNGFVGIPMTLLELTDEHQAAVIEVGIDEPGAMAAHVDVVSPNVSVLTVIQPEHLEKLIDLDTVAREEGIALIETSARGGSIAVNCDDPNIAPHLTDIRIGKRLGYTLSDGCSDDSKPSTVMRGKISADLKTLEVSGADFQKPETFSLPLPGRHNATNLLAAIAVCRLLGLSADEMRAGLSRFNAPEGRSQVRKLSDGTQVICDYYNSQPASLRAGLELLKELPGTSAQTPRWACIADMLELGPQEEQFHREPATWMMDLGVTHVALFGKRMKWLEDELKKRGFRGYLRHFETQAELAQDLSSQAKPGSAILIKGSNSMKMGEVWKAFELARK
jgi:UDP-N-acetylmuramoyl-tripeptide--D-alanyl-D-alanine ligase